MGARPGSHIRNPRRDLVSTVVSWWSNIQDQNFTPASLNPYAWFDAADPTTITESGGFVSQWNDKSGNARNVSQAVGANQPATGASTLNGLNVLTFDGSNDVLTSASNSIDFIAITAFVVFKHTAFGVNLAVPRIFEFTDATGGGILLILRDDSPNDDLAQLIINRNPTASTYTSANGTMPVNTPRKLTAVWRGAYTSADYVFRFEDSEKTGTTVAGSGTKTSNLNVPLRVGNALSGLRSFQGDIAELVIFNRALTLAEINRLELYGKRKWGV
jgi:hypothetical protein